MQEAPTAFMKVAVARWSQGSPATLASVSFWSCGEHNVSLFLVLFPSSPGEGAAHHWHWWERTFSLEKEKMF